MNSSSIRIGNQRCKKGDVFPDSVPIFWIDGNQVIKAMNLNTKQIELFTTRVFTSIDAKTPKDYFLKNKHLSTRGNIVSFADLADVLLADTIYLYDTIQFESPVEVDASSSYLFSYSQNGKMKWQTLKTTGKSLSFSRDLFSENQTDYSIALYFRKKDMEDYLVADNVVIVLLPR